MSQYKAVQEFIPEASQKMFLQRLTQDISNLSLEEVVADLQGYLQQLDMAIVSLGKTREGLQFLQESILEAEK